MSQYEEYVIGNVASEGHYDPSWPTPTWEELGNYLEDQEETEFVLVPLGKIGSDKRTFGSKAAPIHKEDVYALLREYAKEHIASIFPGGNASNEGDVFAASATIQGDPSVSPILTERLCGLHQKIEHLTGWAIKPLR
jgi:hypothetical protein